MQVARTSTIAQTEIQIRHRAKIKTSTTLVSRSTAKAYSTKDENSKD